MSTNLEITTTIINYIEEHLDETLDLDSIALKLNYSKYHIHRIFASMTGLSIHFYIQRRRLTEAARKLIFTTESIVNIATYAGYDSQQSFSYAFKQLFKKSPLAYRRSKEFAPIQLKFETFHYTTSLRGERIMDIRIVNKDSILLAGYKANTRFGFFSIKKCWKKLHKIKDSIPNKIDKDYLIGLNDYSKATDYTKSQIEFDYFAACEISDTNGIPSELEIKSLSSSRYVVFSFKGRSQDSLQPIVEYIYKEWFPQSTYKFNHDAKYDFAKYGEASDEFGNSIIEFWVPVL